MKIFLRIITIASIIFIPFIYLSGAIVYYSLLRSFRIRQRSKKCCHSGYVGHDVDGYLSIYL